MAWVRRLQDVDDPDGDGGLAISALNEERGRGRQARAAGLRGSNYLLSRGAAMSLFRSGNSRRRFFHRLPFPLMLLASVLGPHQAAASSSAGTPEPNADEAYRWWPPL